MGDGVRLRQKILMKAEDSMYCFGFLGAIYTKRVFCYSIVGRMSEISAGFIIITLCQASQSPKFNENPLNFQTNQPKARLLQHFYYGMVCCHMSGQCIPYNKSKMEGVQSFERILAFLTHIGFNFTNERGLVEHCRDGKNLLKIIVEVIKGLEPGSIRSVLAIECHRISEDLDRHRESLPTTSDFLVARRIFAETKFDLRVTDFIHADKPGGSASYAPRLQAILSHLMGVFNWNRQVQANRSSGLGRLKLLERQSRGIAERLQRATGELQQVQQLKLMERAGFEEKTRAFDQLREEIAGTRASKNEMGRLHAEREKELIDKAKELDECVYAQQANEIEVAKARKDLSLNAPQVRKEKLRMDAELEQVLNRQQRLAQHVVRLRNIMQYKLGVLHNCLESLDGLSSLEVLETRRKTLQALGERVRSEENGLKQGLRKLQEEFKVGEREEFDGARLEQSLQRRIAQYTASTSSLQVALEARHFEQAKLAQGIAKLNGVVRKVFGDIGERDRADQQRCEFYTGETRQIERDFDEWQRKLEAALLIAHEPFNMSLFEQDAQ